MRKEDTQQYTQDFFTLAAYGQTYGNAIFPPNVDAATVVEPFNELEDDEEDLGDAILPPKTSVPPGRPKKKRIRGSGEGGGRVSRVFRCTRCRSEEHTSE